MELSALKEMFDSYLRTIAEFERSQEAARAMSRKACDFLHAVRQRQDEAAEHLKGMISELEAEAAALRRTVRENTKRKAQHLLNGEEAPQGDTSAAARLAVIPEEISALKSLAGQRSMTNEERQEWENIVSDLQDAATAISSAISARSAAYGKVRIHMYDTQYWATGASRINLETYITEATALNTYSQEEDNEE